MIQAGNTGEAEKVPQLRIRLFGNIEISRNGKRLTPLASTNAELLFAFLVMNPDRMFNRDTLVEKFLPDESISNARKRLRTMIWQIRSVVETDTSDGKGPPCLITSHRDIGFNRKSQYWLDAAEFETVINQLELNLSAELCPQGALKLRSTLDLYRGDLLESHHREWCIWEKERFKMLHLRGVEMLMKYHASNARWQEAIAYGEHLVGEDPLREHVHRHLMRYHYLVGDRPAALVQFKKCQSLLASELGIEPMQKTIALYDDIKNEQSISLPAAKTPIQHQASAQPNFGLKEISSIAAQIEALSTQLAQGLELAKEMENQSKL